MMRSRVLVWNGTDGRTAIWWLRDLWLFCTCSYRKPFNTDNVIITTKYISETMQFSNTMHFTIEPTNVLWRHFRVPFVIVKLSRGLDFLRLGVEMAARFTFDNLKPDVSPWAFICKSYPTPCGCLKIIHRTFVDYCVFVKLKTSPKWPTLSRVGRWTVTQTVTLGEEMSLTLCKRCMFIKL